MALLDLLPAIKSAVVGPIRSVLLQLRTAIDTTVHVFDTLRGIVDDSVAILHEIQTFDLDPHFKIRVLSVPDALTNVKDLLEVPTRIFVALRDLVQRVRSQVAPIQAAEAEASAALEEASGLEGALLRIFPRLGGLVARAIGRILAGVGIVVQGLIDASNTLADIRTLVGQFRVALEGLNRLDAVFLRQDKKRQTLELKDGTKIRIRVPRRTR